MKRMIFVNMGVADLPKSRQFFTSLGFTFNEQFCDETAACLVISEEIFAMLLTHPKMQGFLPKGNTIADARKTTEMLIALSCENREEVDQLADKALAAGATAYNDPVDYGFMYYRAFQDLDGHIWELTHMSEMPPEQA